MLSKLTSFLTVDIWRIPSKDYPPSKSFLLKQLRIIVLAVRGFAEDKCKFRASALTFYSLLSIVPVIAMMFGIAKGFGLEKKIEAELMQKMQGQEKVAENIIAFSNSFLENTSGGFIAGIGVAFLFWTIIKVLGNIENSFNDIWGVKVPRRLGRKFSDYLSIMLICPFLLVMASSATVAISSQVREIIKESPILSVVAPLILLSLRLLPYCTIWIAFTFVFIFMPNTKVSIKSGFLAGIVAGTIFQIAQWGYINFQIGVAKYNAIYAGFAALPFFLIWLQISWLVILFGAELSFAHQNVETYEFEQDCLSVSNSFKKLLSLLTTHLLVKNFCRGQKAWDATEISHELEIPIRLARQILFELVQSKILCQVKKDEKDVAYQPAIDVSRLTVRHVLDSLDHQGTAEIPVAQSDELNRLSSHLATLAADMEKSPANILLKDL